MDTTIVSSGEPVKGTKLNVVITVIKGKFPDATTCETTTNCEGYILETKYRLEFRLADILNLKTKDEVRLTEGQIGTVKRFVLKLVEAFNVSGSAVKGVRINTGSLIAVITIDGEKIGDLSLETVLNSI